MKYEIYIITNIVNAKQYVGITKNLKYRWSQHSKMNGSSPYLHSAIKKHGVENFVFSHIATAYDLDCAQHIEKILIADHNTKSPNGYNLTDGGEGVNGLSVSDETKKVLSQKSKQMWADPLHFEEQKVLRSSEAYKKSQSDKTKAAMARPEVIEKLKKPKNHGEKIRAIKTGQKQSDETIAKRAKKNTGKKRSDETRLKMSAANKAAWAIRKAKRLAEEGTQNA